MNHDAQRKVQALLDRLVNTGIERGVQVAAYLHGELIVDACAGVMDARSGRRVTPDTLFPVYSTGKGITATAVHQLVEKGLLEYDKPIAHYWPEFGCNSKEKITLRQAMSHTAALPHMPDCADMGDVGDWDAMCSRIAKLSPLWEPGTRTYYHAITFSWLLGEPARRVDGRPFAQIVRQEIFDRLGIDSFYFGIPEDVQDRVAVLEPGPPAPPPATPPPPDPVAGRSIPPWVTPLEEWMNRRDVQRACIPASNAIATAKAVARHYAALLAGELLSHETIDRATQLTNPQNLPLEQIPLKFGLGYVLYGPPEDVGSMLGHGGHGGSTGFANRRSGLAFALAKNRTTNDATARAVLAEIRASIGD